MNKNKIFKKLISIVAIISILPITAINAKGTEQERVYEENGKKYLEVTKEFEDLTSKELTEELKQLQYSYNGKNYTMTIKNPNDDVKWEDFSKKEHKKFTLYTSLSGKEYDNHDKSGFYDNIKNNFFPKQMKFEDKFNYRKDKQYYHYDSNKKEYILNTDPTEGENTFSYAHNKRNNDFFWTFDKIFQFYKPPETYGTFTYPDHGVERAENSPKFLGDLSLTSVRPAKDNTGSAKTSTAVAYSVTRELKPGENAKDLSYRYPEINVEMGRALIGNKFMQDGAPDTIGISYVLPKQILMDRKEYSGYPIKGLGNAVLKVKKVQDNYNGTMDMIYYGSFETGVCTVALDYEGDLTEIKLKATIKYICELIDPDIKPGKPGEILFDPNETPWTNKGKTGEGTGAYPIKVWFNGKDPQKLTGQAEYDYKTCSGSGEKKKCTRHHGWKSVSYTYDINNITVTGDTTGSFPTGRGGIVYLKKEGEHQHLDATGTWRETRGSLPSHATGKVKKPTAPPNPTGSSGYYYIDWTTPVLQKLSAGNTYWTNKGKGNGYPLDFEIFEKVPGSGLKDTKWAVTDTSYYNHSQNGTLADGAKEVTPVNIKLLDGMYKLDVQRGDIAGNKGSDHYEEYLIDLTDPDKAEFEYPGAVLANGQYEYMCEPQNLIKVKYGDNLSGVKVAKYFWSESDQQPNISVMKNISNGTTTDRQKTTKELTFNIHDGETAYKDLKKGKWYLHIYNQDRAGNVTRTVSEPIFVNKIEDFKSSYLHDIRWQYLFQNKVGDTWNDIKQKYIPQYERTNKTFDVSTLPLNGFDHNNKYKTNIKKGYFTEWKYKTYGFNEENARVDIYITYYFWNGSNWERIGTRPGEARYNLYYENDGTHYFPLADFPKKDGGKKGESMDTYLKQGGRDFTHIYGASKQPVKFYNFRSDTSETNNPIFLENKWDMRYAFPFAEAIRAGDYNSGNNTIEKSEALRKPILVNFEIVGTKIYKDGAVKKQYYTKFEDRWKKDPMYQLQSPYNHGNVMVIDSSKSSVNDTYVELN